MHSNVNETIFKDAIPQIIAGPCSVENREQFLRIALAIKEHGGHILRGSIFKPRTKPDSFQGIGLNGLNILKEAKEKTGLLIETEVTDPSQIPLISEYVDIFRIGSRNMQNYELLKALGKTNKPVILKRGMSATIEEWLYAAEYIILYGNPNVILCERGIRTFETATRNTLDISAVPVIKSRSRLPIIIDPSHAAGDRRYVVNMAKAAIAVGADGLMVEVHHDPDNALTDGKQSITIEQFKDMINCVKKISAVI